MEELLVAGLRTYHNTPEEERVPVGETTLPDGDLVAMSMAGQDACVDVQAIQHVEGKKDREELLKVHNLHGHITKCAFFIKRVCIAWHGQLYEIYTPRHPNSARMGQVWGYCMTHCNCTATVPLIQFFKNQAKSPLGGDEGQQQGHPRPSMCLRTGA